MRSKGRRTQRGSERRGEALKVTQRDNGRKQMNQCLVAGVTLEDLKSAEQLVKKKQQQENATRTTELQQLASAGPPSPPTASPSPASTHPSTTATTTVTTSATLVNNIPYFYLLRTTHKILIGHNHHHHTGDSKSMQIHCDLYCHSTPAQLFASGSVCHTEVLYILGLF